MQSLLIAVSAFVACAWAACPDAELYDPVKFNINGLKNKRFCKDLSVNDCLFIHEAGIKCACTCEAKITGGETGEGGGDEDSSSGSDENSGSNENNNGNNGNGNNDDYGNGDGNGDGNGGGPTNPNYAYYDTYVYGDDDDGSTVSSNVVVCFNADSTVTTQDGQQLTMPQLHALTIKQTTLIQAWDPSTQSLIYSPVTYWLHMDHQQQASFIRVNDRISLSKAHMIYRAPNCQLHDTYESVFAESVQIGDCLLVRDEPESALRQEPVRDLQSVRSTGVYAPITEVGTVIVDGVLASCFAAFENQGLMSMMSGWQQVFGGFFKDSSLLQDDRIPLIPLACLELRSYLFA